MICSAGFVLATTRVEGLGGKSMGTDTLASQQRRLTGRRWFWVISIAFLFLLSVIVISTETGAPKQVRCTETGATHLNATAPKQVPST